MGSFAMMNLANASLDNIAEINNLPTENEKQGTTQFADTQADVRFENVSFSYDGKRDAVSHVSFQLNPERSLHWWVLLEAANPLSLI